MSELSSKFNIDSSDFYTNFTFEQLTKKKFKENSTNENIWLLYVCHTMSYYDMLFDAMPRITLDNRTCFFYKNISYSLNQLYFFDVH